MICTNVYIETGSKRIFRTIQYGMKRDYSMKGMADAHLNHSFNRT